MSLISGELGSLRNCENCCLCDAIWDADTGIGTPLDWPAVPPDVEGIDAAADPP